MKTIKRTAANEAGALIRDARGPMPLHELARRSGIPVAELGAIEAGTVGDPSREKIVRIVSALAEAPTPLSLVGPPISAGESETRSVDLRLQLAELMEIADGAG